MEIQPIGSEVARIVNLLDKKLPENNPSIFLQNEEEPKIDNDFLFRQLYTN